MRAQISQGISSLLCWGLQWKRQATFQVQRRKADKSRRGITLHDQRHSSLPFPSFLPLFFQMASFSFLLSAHQGKATQAECLGFACIISWTTLSPCCTDSRVYVSCPLRHVNPPSSLSSIPVSSLLFHNTKSTNLVQIPIHLNTQTPPTPPQAQTQPFMRHISHLSDQHIPLQNNDTF